MKMWNINPKFMCNQHLIGEHVEMHMFVGCINKGIRITGYIVKGLVDTSLLKFRHEELVREMEERGMKHNTLFPNFFYPNEGNVNIENSCLELFERCEKCRRRLFEVVEGFKIL